MLRTCRDRLWGVLVMPDLHVKMILPADGMGDVIWQRPKPNTGQRGPVLILRLQLRQAAALDQKEVRSFLQPLLLSHHHSFHQL